MLKDGFMRNEGNGKSGQKEMFFSFQIDKILKWKTIRSVAQDYENAYFHSLLVGV